MSDDKKALADDYPRPTPPPDVDSGDGRRRCFSCGKVHPTVTGGMICLELELSRLRNRLQPIGGMKRAFIISRYSGDIDINLAYARKCLHYAFSAGYAPFAGHMIYPQVLNDADSKERDFMMRAAYAFLAISDVAFGCMDLGASDGMRADLRAAERLGVKIDYISILGGVPTVDAIHNFGLPHAHMPCALCQDAK